MDVHDAAALEHYRKRVPASIANYGGRHLGRGGATVRNDPRRGCGLS